MKSSDQNSATEHTKDMSEHMEAEFGCCLNDFCYELFNEADEGHRQTYIGTHYIHNNSTGMLKSCYSVM